MMASNFTGMASLPRASTKAPASAKPISAGSRCDLLDRVDGALAAKNVHIEPFGLLIPLLERDVVIGVSPIEAEIGDEIHVGSLCRKGAARGRGRGHKNAQSSKRPHD